MVLLEFFAPLHFYDHTLYDTYMSVRGRGTGREDSPRLLPLFVHFFGPICRKHRKHRKHRKRRKHKSFLNLNRYTMACLHVICCN